MFEFGLGRYVAGDSWTKLLEQYDLTRGNVWILVPIWMAIGPAVMRRLRSGRIGTQQEALVLLGRPLPMVETDRAALLAVVTLAAIKVAIAALVPLKV